MSENENYDDPYANLYQTPKRPNVNASSSKDNNSSSIKRLNPNNNFSQQGQIKRVFNPYGNDQENEEDNQNVSNGNIYNNCD